MRIKQITGCAFIVMSFPLFLTMEPHCLILSFVLFFLGAYFTKENPQESASELKPAVPSLSRPRGPDDDEEFIRSLGKAR